MSAQIGIAALTMLVATVSCTAVSVEMPQHWSTATPVAESTASGATLRGLRFSLEGPLAKGWTAHLVGQELSTGELEFGIPGGATWDDVSETAFGVRRWWHLGPMLGSLGGEFGFGFGGKQLSDDDEPYYLVAAVGSLRWDLEAGDAGALALEADLHYRAPVELSADALGSGEAARDVFGGWVLFFGVGWSW